MNNHITPERRALMWVYDRLSVDGLTAKEIAKTHREIGNVILGRKSPASDYDPDLKDTR